MGPEAEQIFDYLPEDGTKVSGGQIKDALSLSVSEYKTAKVELSMSGVVILGRGRGGTIARIVGAEKPAKAHKVTKAERMAFARETRASNARHIEKRDKIHDAAMEIAKERYPQADKLEIQIWNMDQGHCYIYPWVDGIAKTDEVYVEV